MKKCMLCAATLLGGLMAFSQNHPLTNRPFAKMMTDLFNFTLTGNQTPTSGFKVETDKPKIGIKGNLYVSENRSTIINLELQGGLDEGVMNLLSGKDVSSYFKALIGFNFLTRYNSAGYPTRTDANMQIVDQAKRINREQVAAQLDTFCVLEVILKDPGFTSYTATQFREEVKTKFNSYTIHTFTRQYRNGNIDDHFDSLIKQTLEAYGTTKGADPGTTLANFHAERVVAANCKIKLAKLLQDFKRLGDYDLENDKRYLDNKVFDADIDLVKHIYNWKSIIWFNVTLSGTNANFKLYDAAADKLNDSSSFLPAITGSFNRFRKGKNVHQFQYYRAGLTLQRNNSLVDLQKFNYNKETVITTGPGETLKSTKEGTAYQGELKQKFGYAIFFEGYALPWTKAFIPGFYFETKLSYSEAWLNKTKLGLNVGMVWSVNSSDKDAKNVLSIVPYMGWTNFLKEYKDATKTEEKKLSDLFTVGVKLSIPVNLGK